MNKSTYWIKFIIFVDTVCVITALFFFFQPLLMSTDIALALNRYMCHSVLPLITNNVAFLEGREHRVSLLDSVLNTIYRMSKCSSLTNAQKEVISNCLVSVAG